MEEVLHRAYGPVVAVVRRTIGMVPELVAALLVLAFLYILGRMLGWLIRISTNRLGRHRNLGLAVGRLTQWAVILGGVLISVTIAFPSFTPGDLVQVLGISSVAIGFAFRDILQNFLAGVLLLLTQPFRAGDQIIFDRYEGTVEDVQARATIIRTYDNRRVVIPNASLFMQSVLVNTAFEVRRMEYDVGIGPSDDVERARTVIREALRSCSSVEHEPAPEVLVVELADFSVRLRVRWWFKPPRRADSLFTQDEVLGTIKQRLTEAGIDLPFPTQQVLFHDQTEEWDGDRARQREGWPAGTDRVVPSARADVLRADNATPSPSLRPFRPRGRSPSTPRGERQR